MTDILPPPPDTAAVLCYHGVSADAVDPDVQTVQVPAETFREQLDQLARSHELVPLGVLADHLLGGRPLGAPKAVITFDDGYRNVLDVAEPLLRERRIPFAVFVSTRHITTGERFPTHVLRAALHTAPPGEVRLPSAARTYRLGDRTSRQRAVADLLPVLKAADLRVVRRLVGELRGLLPAGDWPEVERRFAADAVLDWAGVRALARAGAEIGSHGHDHAILHERESPAEVRRQLVDSRRQIEARCGPCRYFAYPNGGTADVGPYAARQVPASGYRLGFAAVRGLLTAGAAPNLLPRVFAPAEPGRLPSRLGEAAAATARYLSWQRGLGAPRTRGASDDGAR
ncbi:polysaccharide deacetylase family protein [Kitasatospora sp. NPDC056138]|uniref:polysaccharide deacetylase family protein n=1 Tax=Kitasatospora sp. NPDC056138 TaxID=3345724 RepID=UPI0035E1B729